MKEVPWGGAKGWIKMTEKKKKKKKREKSLKRLTAFEVLLNQVNWWRY